MRILFENKSFCISNDLSSNAVCEILQPVYIENGTEKEIPIIESRENYEFYKDDENEVILSLKQISDTLFHISRTWKNISDSTRYIHVAQRIRPTFEVNKYLIPCVNINGNEFGAGFEPKGLERDGKRWIFGYDRVSIPSCTLTENAEFACALFASNEDVISLESSCSIYKDSEGKFVQELSHPIAELPVTYSSRDEYAEGYESFLTLEPNEEITLGAYLSVSKPRWENYGICEVLDQALKLYENDKEIDSPSKKDLWDRSIAFAKSLITDYKGKKGFIIGYLPDGNGGFSYRDKVSFSLAWCGQNILLSRMLIEDYIRFGNKDSLDEALEILDTRVSYCVASTGLLAEQLRDYENLETAVADTCNMGYGAYEFVRIYLTLKKIGIDKPEYLNAAKGLCDFFVDNFSDEFGFGKQWRLDGECVDKGGTIGGFIIPALMATYEVLGDKKYLELAECSMRFYMERELNNFVSTAGALDTCCVDKETSFPFIVSGILLYENTKKEIYLEYAKKAAYYFTSWMFHYNPRYKEDSEIEKYNVSVMGLTSVSTQHHHLDMYAGIVVPYLRKLAILTGEEDWRIRADIMWNAVTQYISDGSLVVHDRVRPVGSQNEALFHCRWGFGGFSCEARGRLNDWLVAWPCAFRLSVLAEEEF